MTKSTLERMKVWEYYGETKDGNVWKYRGEGWVDEKTGTIRFHSAEGDEV